MQHIENTQQHKRYRSGVAGKCESMCALQHTTVHCNTLTTHSNALHHITMHCNTLQHTDNAPQRSRYQPGVAGGMEGDARTTTHYSTLQHTETHCNTLQHTIDDTPQHRRYRPRVAGGTGADARTATHNSTLQHTTAHCNTLHHTATYCNTLTTHCNTGAIAQEWLGIWEESRVSEGGVNVQSVMSRARTYTPTHTCSANLSAGWKKALVGNRCVVCAYQKSPIYYQKSPTHYQKSPIFYETSLVF